MAYPARWVEDVAGYVGAGAAGFGLGYATRQKASSDPMKVASALVPVVAGGLMAAYLGGWLASAGQGIAYGGMGALGLFAQAYLEAQKKPSVTPAPSGYRAWRSPSTFAARPIGPVSAAGRVGDDLADALTASSL